MENINEKIFKDGYVFQVEVLDFDSDEIKTEINNCITEQKKCMDRLVIDQESLNKRCTI